MLLIKMSSFKYNRPVMVYRRSRVIVKSITNSYNNENDDKRYRRNYFIRKANEFQNMYNFTPEEINGCKLKTSITAKWGADICIDIEQVNEKYYMKIFKKEGPCLEEDCDKVAQKLSEWNIGEVVLKMIKVHPNEQGPLGGEKIYIPLNVYK